MAKAKVEVKEEVKAVEEAKPVVKEVTQAPSGDLLRLVERLDERYGVLESRITALENRPGKDR